MQHSYNGVNSPSRRKVRGAHHLWQKSLMLCMGEFTDGGLLASHAFIQTRPLSD
jgi:hypothetical protein